MQDVLRVGVIYAGLIIATALYSVWLERLNKRYEPDFTWLTVVGGNAQIGIAFVLICLYAPPSVPLGYAGHLAGLNVAGGLPIIAWQLWQRERRLAERRARDEKKQQEQQR